MTSSKRTTDLQAGDVVLTATGCVMMTIRRTADAVCPLHKVLFVTGPKGGKKSLGALRTAIWHVEVAR